MHETPGLPSLPWREVRAFSGWGKSQLKVHFARLVELEYLAIHHSVRGLSYEYELVWDGQGVDGRPVLFGLLDVAALAQRHRYDADRSASKAGWLGPGRSLVRGWSALGKRLFSA